LQQKTLKAGSQKNGAATAYKKIFSCLQADGTHIAFGCFNRRGDYFLPVIELFNPH